MASVDAIRIDQLPAIRDERGGLVVAEFRDYVPFQVVRLFYVHDVPADTVRGQHAHRRCRQYVICQTGRVAIEAHDGTRTRRVELQAGQAVLVEPGIFFSETYADPDTVLLVLCDRPYEPDDYIRSLDEFLAAYSGQ